MDRISGRSLAARLFGASPARTLALLEAVWPLAVGPELARRTEVLGIEGGTLRVRVPDAGWRKVLHRMQPQILGHLREIAGDLAPRRMGFVEGGMTDQPQSTAASRSDGDVRGGFQGGSRVPIFQGTSAPPEVEDVAATIDDSEIRTRFLEVATRYLERSKGRNDA
jgi:Dna[CI] antecedent DciA-like protein